jgi:hypothetical protein
VSWNRVQKKSFGLKREEVTGGLRKSHNDEVHELYTPSVIVSMANSRKMS